jgi:hypothetical protein
LLIRDFIGVDQIAVHALPRKTDMDPEDEETGRQSVNMWVGQD